MVEKMLMGGCRVCSVGSSLGKSKVRAGSTPPTPMTASQQLPLTVKGRGQSWTHDLQDHVRGTQGAGDQEGPWAVG